jgi:hypothetical protein
MRCPFRLSLRNWTHSLPQIPVGRDPRSWPMPKPRRLRLIRKLPLRRASTHVVGWVDTLVPATPSRGYGMWDNTVIVNQCSHKDCPIAMRTCKQLSSTP